MTTSTFSLLVVDDEVDTCRNLSDIFNEMGYRVDTAHDAHTALNKVHDSAYDVAVLDLMMPGMDGLTLYEEIKRVRPETVTLLATAYPHHPRAELALQAGVWRIVPKPVELSMLFALLDEVGTQPLILVVDDDPDLCANLWDLFRGQGFRVSTANTVQAASDRLRDNAFQVVLIDLRLPDGDGTAVFDLVRHLRPTPRTIIITGYGNEVESSIERLQTEGADAVCLKPFDVKQLMTTVARLGKRLD